MELNGKCAIGRGSASKLRIDHPLVSRDHAVIDHTDQGYFIRDCGSRNGTIVNDKPLKLPVRLQDGDRIAIGPTTIWFRADGNDPHIETLPVHNADEGVVFECNCGARLWAPMTLAGSTVRCRRCSRDVACPTIFTPVSADPSSTSSAGMAAVGLCSICLSNVTTADEQHVCESCGAVYHDECWVENCGCAAYGCKQVNVLAEDRDVTGTAAPVMEDDLAIEEDLKTPSSVPWDAALVGASVVGSLLGLLLFGTLALIVAVASGAYLLRRRTAWVAAAVVISLIGFIAGVMVSGLWWLKISPLEWFGK